ncbi:MAG: glycosyltransferase family 2 protein [Nanoarchaeota archaeon]
MANVLVLIPAYNEDAHIRQVIRDCRKVGFDLLVIDDGSTDTTVATAREEKAKILRNPQNRGKGYSIQKGLRYAEKHGYEIAVTIDADGQHDPRFIPELVSALKDGDMVIGARKRSQEMPLIRRMSNTVSSYLLSKKLGTFIPDSQSGFRAMRLSAVNPTDGESAGYEYESEILIQLARRKKKIRSIPISTIYGTEKSTYHPIRDTLRFFRILLK